MAQKFSNAARAYLSAGISDTDTTITISAGGSLFPTISGSDFCRAVLQDSTGIEIVLVTAHTAGSTSFTVTRGQEGTTARAFASGSVFGVRLTAADGDTFAAKVAGPASATDSALVAFDGTTGKLIKQASTVTVAQGGTGQTSYTNGQLLIGNSTGNTLTKATLTAGSGVSITNGTGSITISATGTGGDVVGPASATDNAIVRFDGTTGKLVQNSAATIDDTTGDITGGKYNKVTITPPATGSTLTIANGKTLTANNSLTLAGTDGTTMTFPGVNASVGYLNLPAVGTKTGSYILAVADVGKYVQVGSGGSITIPNATFAEGDAVSIFNNTTGNITITCSITTAYIAGTDTDKATMTLATRGVATVLFISSTVCVVSGNVT